MKKKMVHWTCWHIGREPLRMSNLKEREQWARLESNHHRMDQANEEADTSGKEERGILH
jgi:hypothetical protein